MCDIPIDIFDEEKIARAIKTPYHLNKKKTKLKAAAFRPPAERDDLSVMRLEYMGANQCKAKAKEISGTAYIGLAAINADEIRKSGASVKDSRDGQFCGHADIGQGVPAPKKGEAPPTCLLERYKALADVARLYIDPEPCGEQWTGAAIE